MISIDLIKQLRELTGAGIADCRSALDEAGSDLAKAEEIIKAKGLEKAAKKGERETGQGRVFSYVHATGKIGVVVSLLCETDFVAKTDDFVNLGKEICLQIASMEPQSVDELLKQEYIRDGSQTIENLIKLVVGKLGENIRIDEFKRLTV
jgi:elongation factor Ts